MANASIKMSRRPIKARVAVVLFTSMDSVRLIVLIITIMLDLYSDSTILFTR